jgi:replication factor A1
MINGKEVNVMKVKELSPGMRKIEIVVKVVKKEKPRTVTVKRDGSQHQVADLLVGDDTGMVSMSLWDDMISQIRENDIIQISNGYVGEFGGKIQLNIGKFGQWTRLDPKDSDIDVYLEELDAGAAGGSAQFVKVVDCLRRSSRINLVVQVVDQLPSRSVTTKRDGQSHIINTFVVGDETGVINFDLWDQGDEIAVGDVLEIEGAYTREFNKVLSLNLSRAGSYEKSRESVPEVNKDRNLSEPAI